MTIIMALRVQTWKGSRATRMTTVVVAVMMMECTMECTLPYPPYPPTVLRMREINAVRLHGVALAEVEVEVEVEGREDGAIESLMAGMAGMAVTTIVTATVTATVNVSTIRITVMAGMSDGCMHQEG